MGLQSRVVTPGGQLALRCDPVSARCNLQGQVEMLQGGEGVGGWPHSVSRASSPPWAKDSPISASALGERDIAAAFRELLDTPEPAVCPHPLLQDP